MALQIVLIQALGSTNWYITVHGEATAFGRACRHIFKLCT